MSHRNPYPAPNFHPDELFLTLLPSVPPQISPAHSFLPESRPSQFVASHIHELGAQDVCTSHSACAQSAPHSRRHSICLYLRPFCRRWHHRVIFRSSQSRSCLPRRGDLPSAIKTVTLKSMAASPVLPRSTVVVPFDTKRAFESCYCLRSLLY